MREGFDAKRLVHVEGFAGKIEDQDQARAMAEHEDKVREESKRYAEYLETGALSRGEAGSAGIEEDLYKAYKEAGVTPEYLLNIRQIHSVELEAAARDYADSMQYSTRSELESAIRQLKEQISSESHKTKAALRNSLLADPLERDNKTHFDPENQNDILRTEIALEKINILQKLLARKENKMDQAA